MSLCGDLQLLPEVDYTNWGLIYTKTTGKFWILEFGFSSSCLRPKHPLTISDIGTRTEVLLLLIHRALPCALAFRPSAEEYLALRLQRFVFHFIFHPSFHDYRVDP
jgi:hypothetical protein